MLEDKVRRLYRRNKALQPIARYVTYPRNILTRLVSPYKLRQLRKADSGIKLNVGCGFVKPGGWVNSDIKYGDVYIDLTKQLPFYDNSVEYIFCEHTIEHVEHRKVECFFAECYRVLEGGGVFRVTTPDLAFFVRAYMGEGRISVEDIVARDRDKKYHDVMLYGDSSEENKCCMLNNFFFSWDHCFLWDYDYLYSCLDRVGFSKIVRCQALESEHAELRGLEKHGSGWWLKEATLIVEATK